MTKRDLVEDAVTGFNRRDLDTYMQLYHDELVAHGYAPNPVDLEGLRAFYAGLLASFPDATIRIEDTAEQGSTLAIRFTFEGTHEAEFMGVPPTGRSVSVPGQTFMSFDGDRVRERWNNVDLMALMEQIGAVQTGAPATG